jgi:hypothetical protein
VNKTILVAQLESQINELKRQLDLLPNNPQSKKQTMKSKLDDVHNKLAKKMISQRFKLELEQFSPEVPVKHYHSSSKIVIFRCKMKQIPAYSNDATTSPKLQGMSKDAIIVSIWPTGGLAAMFKNWEYVVLSCVQTLSRLYLVKPIDGQLIPAIAPTNIVHGQNKKIGEINAGGMPTCNKQMLEKCQHALSIIFS